MVTKKDMIVAAELLVKTYPINGAVPPAARREAAEVFCEFFAQTNSQFDREQFLNACGL